MSCLSSHFLIRLRLLLFHLLLLLVCVGGVHVERDGEEGDESGGDPDAGDGRGHGAAGDQLGVLQRVLDVHVSGSGGRKWRRIINRTTWFSILG